MSTGPSDGPRRRPANQELERRYESTARALRIHEELTRIAAEGDDLVAVLRAVWLLTGGDVALVGDDDRMLAVWLVPAPSKPEKMSSAFG